MSLWGSRQRRKGREGGDERERERALGHREKVVYEEAVHACFLVFLVFLVLPPSLK